MKTTTNVFLDGLTTDMHPLTTKNNLLTDALNATLRTFNGNELVLQNDMGNTMILDSTTGNIMGLRDGFVPIGMKEHGGVLYIASYNLETNEGELGTIPSPLINYTYKEPSKTNSIVSITNINDSNSLINLFLPKYLLQPFKISNTRFLVGDLFIVSLKFSDNTHNIITTRTHYTETQEIKDHPYTIITGFNGDIENHGWFKLCLEAKVEKSSDTLSLSNIDTKPQQYYLNDALLLQTSKYWFVEDSQEYLDLDNERCLAANYYRTYPNILPGYLYVQAKAELPENFEFFVNKSTNIKSPYIYILTELEPTQE